MACQNVPDGFAAGAMATIAAMRATHSNFFLGFIANNTIWS
jgi:hypothetical protein